MQSLEYKRIEKLENIHFWYRAMEEMILYLVKQNVKGRVNILDAGCGTGGLSEKMESFGRVTAIDINPVALKIAREKKIDKLLKASVERLPFQDNSFHLIVSLDVLYHQKVKSDIKALSELYRVLKPGGVLILRLPAFEFLRGAHDIVVQTRHRYTTYEVSKKMQQAGFKIKKLSYVNMLLSIPLFVKRSYERFYKKHSLVSDTILLPELLNKIFYFILKNDNKLLKFINLPFGSSVLSIGLKNPIP